ncbi:MAG: diguanylate cyclase [Pseudomonadota bacterium]
MDTEQQFDLSEAMENCAKEPIHIPGAVQPHGALLAFDKKLQNVIVASESCDSFFERDLNQIFAEPIEEWIPAEMIDLLKRSVKRLTRKTITDYFEVSVPGIENTRCFCIVYRSEQLIVVEIEPVYVQLGGDFTATVRLQFDRLKQVKTERQTLAQLAKSAAAISNYDRTLVYKFDADWNGEVVAEHLKESSLTSYLGQHFPASDIPPQVRAMYSANAVRKIVAADAESSQLVKNPAVETSVEAIDLSPGMLQAVSPIHATYMQNMGVCRSISVAIFDENKLWGLLSCHGTQPARTTPYQRHALHSLVLMASQRLMLQRQYQAQRFFDSVEESRKALLDPDKEIMPPKQLLANQGKQWLGLFDVNCVALVHGNEVSQVGDKLSRKNMMELANWLRENHWVTGLYSTRELGASSCKEFFEGTKFCGMLAVSMPYERELNGWLIMLRFEAVEVRDWAGRPEKSQVQEYQGKTVLSPRQSFDKFQQQIEGRSFEWTPEQKQAARTLAEDLAIGASAYQIEQLNEQLQKANDRLEHLVHTDALTQLWNRYHMEQTLDEEIARSERHSHPLSVIIFDIDNFKNINDSHGHEVGDDVLKGISRALAAEMRTSDSLGRWGGEEFLVIAKESTLSDSMQLAERLRERLEGIEFDKVGIVTASFGLAEFSLGETRNDVVRNADNALYKAKAQGRNQVQSA